MGEFTDLIARTEGADRAALQQILDVVREVVPEVAEGLSYGTPALLHRGRPLIGIAVAAKHLSLYPFSAAVVAAVADQLPASRVSKGTIRFTAEQPLPTALLRQVIELRLAEIEAAR